MNWKMHLTGRPEFEFGGIHCEFARSAHVLPFLINSVKTFFISGIDVLSAHQQPNIEICETA